MAPQNETVFITGATGFIGSHVVSQTLAAGYNVLLSIRRKEQALEIRSRLEAPRSRVEFVHIENLTEPGAFKEPLAGVDYVFHLASPLPGKGGDFKKDYLDPAVNGTLAILQEASHHKKIKFIIVMSSVLALVPMGAMAKPKPHPRANSGERLKVDIEHDFPSGPLGDGMKYQASKILAHQATRDFMEKERPGFKLLTFHPVFVLGDSVIQKTAEQIDVINGRFLQSLGSREPLIASAFVHVRDVAEAHISALQRHQKLADGTEYILSAPIRGWQNAAEVVRTQFPQVDVGLREGPFSPHDDWIVDTVPVEKDLEVRWRTDENMIKDVLNQQLRLKQKASS